MDIFTNSLVFGENDNRADLADTISDVACVHIGKRGWEIIRTGPIYCCRCPLNGERCPDSDGKYISLTRRKSEEPLHNPGNKDVWAKTAATLNTPNSPDGCRTPSIRNRDLN